MIKKTLVMFLALLILTFLSAIAQEETATAAEEPGEETSQVMEEKVPGLTVEAQICTAIEDRMPVGSGDMFPPDVDTLFFWSRITGAQDSISIHHVWSYEGEEKLNFELPVKSPPWRAWTYKTILPEWTGQWEAKIIGPDGTIMATIPFTVSKQTKEEVVKEE
jgi:hypothetical protein